MSDKMYKVVGVKTRRIYGSAATQLTAEKLRLLIAEEERIVPTFFEVIGPTCKVCGKACPCGKRRATT